MKACILVATLLAAVEATDPVTWVDFSNGNPGYGWNEVNDPVMGGASYSNITLASDRLEWGGTVRNIPSLGAPGFCKILTSGFNKFISAKGLTYFTLRVRSEVCISLQFLTISLTYETDTIHGVQSVLRIRNPSVSFVQGMS